MNRFAKFYRMQSVVLVFIVLSILVGFLLTMYGDGI